MANRRRWRNTGIYEGRPPPSFGRLSYRLAARRGIVTNAARPFEAVRWYTSESRFYWSIAMPVMAKYTYNNFNNLLNIKITL